MRFRSTEHHDCTIASYYIALFTDSKQLSLSLFYIWRNWGTEHENDLPMVLYQVSSRAKSRTPVIQVPTSVLFIGLCCQASLIIGSLSLPDKSFQFWCWYYASNCGLWALKVERFPHRSLHIMKIKSVWAVRVDQKNAFFLSLARCLALAVELH